MLNFKHFLEDGKRISNTDSADVNEILYGYFMANENWNIFHGAADAKRQLESKVKKITKSEYVDQEGRAKAMANETIKWMKANGYGRVSEVWWTARPGVLAKAVGVDVDSRKNPTDVLVIDNNGYPLGLSAKSTKTKGDIGFKNPGIGTIDKSLNINLKKLYDDELEKTIKQFNLPETAAARKKFIRENPGIQKQTTAIGIKLMANIRDEFMKKINSLSQDKLKEYLFSDWMDVSDGLYPPYIKVTGQGKGGNYSATLMDPLKNSKISALNTDKIKLSKVGNESIGVQAGTKKIMKMRVKFESEKMASSIKFSGDPW